MGAGQFFSLTGGIDAYGQILPNGITITQEGIEYESPSVTIIADPNQPAPSRDANITVSLYHPEGDIYKAKVADLNGSSGSLRFYAERVSEHRQGRQVGSFIGANRPSRDPSISYDGQTIVYSTKSSNLLDDNVTREDDKTFYNKPFSMARARAILVGGIGEIEVQNGGSGYQSGFLKIEDYSGGGSGAVASYQVDTYGRISSITMVNNGADYDLNTTVVSVDNPRGGTGFVAGTIRFPAVSGIGQNRTGGAKVSRIEMISNEAGYESYESNVTKPSDKQNLITIDGDGIDTDENGLPDAKIDSELIEVVSGGVYIRQNFDIEFISTTSLSTTVLTIADANETIQVKFADISAPPFTIGIVDNISSMQNDLIGVIKRHLTDANTEVNSTGDNFTFSALSANFETNNPTSIRISAQSNMLFSGRDLAELPCYCSTASNPWLFGNHSWNGYCFNIKWKAAL